MTRLAGMLGLVLCATLSGELGAQLSPRRMAGQKANSVEAAVGTELLPFRSDYDGRAVATMVGLRHRFDVTLVAARVTAWWLHRTVDSSGQPPETDDIVALTGALDIPIEIDEDMTLEPYAGAGIAPLRETDFGGTEFSRTAAVFVGGVAFRVRHLVLAQHIFLAPNRATTRFRREFFPLTIGWRF